MKASLVVIFGHEASRSRNMSEQMSVLLEIAVDSSLAKHFRAYTWLAGVVVIAMLKYSAWLCSSVSQGEFSQRLS